MRVMPEEERLEMLDMLAKGKSSVESKIQVRMLASMQDLLPVLFKGHILLSFLFW